MVSETLRSAVRDLLHATVGFQADFTLSPLVGGANNRVFRLNAGPHTLLLKVYFYDERDRRNRLATEFSFSSFAWGHGIRSLAQPIGRDPNNHLGLYEYIKGRKLLPSEIDDSAIDQALDFYEEINRYREAASAQNLPEASEACFSLSEHIHCVEQRLQKLQQIEQSSAIDRQASHWITETLLKEWDKIVKHIYKQSDDMGLPLKKEIAKRDRRFSPSDFGFHNAILDENRRLRFIDFEYAGWDDPAKTVCDFFSQPAVPVPFSYYERWVETICASLSEPDIYHQRISLLLPIYKIKWCCILLNDFLPVSNRRRQFADKSRNQERQKTHQLQKAHHALR